MSFRLLAHNQLTIRLYQREQNVSLDNSISKVEIDNSIQFQKLNRKPNRKNESNRQDYYF